MGKKTKIEFCDSSCNPIMGCNPGCSLYSPDPKQNHCYAATLINRYAGRKGWPEHFNQPEHFPGRLEKAIKWPDLTGKERPNKPWLDGRPRIIFVNDLSDGFCPDVDPVEWLAPYLPLIAASPHILLLLTKWPHRMREFCADYPLPKNVWPGVSVLRQKDEWRIRQLLEISAAQHWLSCEPLLGTIVLPPCPHCHGESLPWPNYYGVPLSGPEPEGFCRPCEGTGQVLDWVIVGGESGPGARPMHPDHARGVRDQCQAAGIPFFFKQWGRFVPESHWEQLTLEERNRPGAVYSFDDKPFPLNQRMYRATKKQAGRELDGRTWDEFPQ